jgi:hypothetical protein
MGVDPRNLGKFTVEVVQERFIVEYLDLQGSMATTTSYQNEVMTLFIGLLNFI